jgi:hypothetical protein
MQTHPLLLKEYHALSPNSYEIKEINGSPRVVLKGVLQRANAINGNGRVYEKKILEREINRYGQFISEKRSVGELDHCNSTEVNLKNASHVVENVWWEGNELKGQIRLLNTTAGKEAQALINDGITLGISTRGLGSVTERDGIVTVNEDYHLVCWDLVHDPSTTGAFMLKEGKYIRVDSGWSGPEIVTDPSVSKNSKLQGIVNAILGKR